MTSYPVFGCDVSIWQDDNSTPQQVDFRKMFGAGARFVFVKASQSNWIDQDLIYNWTSARSANLVRGAYHYLTYDVSPIVQADYYWSLMRNDTGDLPLTVDFENRAAGLTRARASGDLRAFCERLTQLSGRLPMIYTSPGYWGEFGTTDVYWKQYRLWLAHYTAVDPITGQYKAPTIPLPWTDWLFWQYTSHGDGKLYGTESLNVDMDNFNGTLDQLYAVAGWTHPPAPIQATWEEQIDAWARTQPDPYTGIGPEGVQPAPGRWSQ